MSTISEALKKAQKQRLGIQAVDDIPPQAPLSDPPKPVPVPPYASGRPSFILILVCVTVLAVAWVYYMLGMKEAELSKGDLPIPAPKPEVVVSAPKPEVIDSPPVSVAIAEAGTTEVAVIQAPPPKVARTDIPVLKGIFYSEKNPVAIINGSAMKEGEMVGAYRVEKISTYRVTLTCDGDEVELRLE